MLGPHSSYASSYMAPIAFQLFRINFRDRVNLFPHPIANDDDLISILREATEARCDIEDNYKRSGYRWSLRALTDGVIATNDRHFATITFAKEQLYKRGSVVSSSGMRTAVSYSDPPLAQGTLIVIDLKRHILAVQDSFQVMKGRNMIWKKKLQAVLSYAAHWQEFTSTIELDPIAPRPFVESELRKFDRITRLRVTLRIPNPDLSDTYRRLYEEMQRGGVREFTEDMRSTKGLDLTGQSLPGASLDMALSGYRSGAIRIDGYIGDQPLPLKIDAEVARIEISDVERIRAYAEGVRDGTSSDEVASAAAMVIAKIDETLDNIKTRRKNDAT